MKTVAASIALLLIVLIGGILSMQTRPQTQQMQTVQHAETEPPEQDEPRETFQWGEAMPDYYQVIIDNNLFRPLGTKPELESDSSPFQLVGTILNNEARTYQAVLKDTASQQVHVVTLYETLNGWQLIDIAPKQVLLEKDNRRITIELSQELFLNPQHRSRTP